MKRVIAIFMCTFILSGCAGLADYTIQLPNGYSIDRLSAHKIEIYGVEPVEDDDDTLFNYLYVPAEVTAIWYDEQYIIAKQLHETVNDNSTSSPPKEITEEDYSYWIIEMHQHTTNGPLTKKQLDEQCEILNIQVDFIPIEALKGEY